MHDDFCCLYDACDEDFLVWRWVCGLVVLDVREVRVDR